MCEKKHAGSLFVWYPAVDLPTELHAVKLYVTQRGEPCINGQSSCRSCGYGRIKTRLIFCCSSQARGASAMAWQRISWLPVGPPHIPWLARDGLNARPASSSTKANQSRTRADGEPAPSTPTRRRVELCMQELHKMSRQAEREGVVGGSLMGGRSIAVREAGGEAVVLLCCSCA